MAVIVSATGDSQPVTRATATQLVYANGYWWLFYYTSANTSTLNCQYSSNLVTWTQGATLSTIFANTGDTFGFDAVAQEINGVWVFHIVQAYAGIGGGNYKATTHVRATLSGTTLIYGTETQVSGTAYDGTAWECGPKICILSTGYVLISSSYWTDTYYIANPAANMSANPDTGTSWTEGTWPSPAYGFTGVNGYSGAHFVCSIGSGNGLIITDDAQDSSTLNGLYYVVYNGSSYSGWTSFVTFGSALDRNDFCAMRLNDNDVHVVARTANNTLSHYRYNNGSWISGATIPTQTSLAASGPKLINDGTNVWLFIIDSDANNSIRYIKWNGTSWDASWTSFETSAKTRTNLAGPDFANSSTLYPIWWEGSSDITGEGMNTSGTSGGNVSPQTATVSNFAPGNIQGGPAYYAY